MFFNLRKWTERKAAQRKAGRKTKPWRRWVRLQLEELEDRRLLATPFVTFHGGGAAAGVPPVLGNVEIQPIYMGWNGTLPAQTQPFMDNYFNALAPSAYVTSLAEYSANGTVIGPGSSDLGIVDNNVNYLNSIITDSQIQRELQALIANPASGIAAPNNNIFYVVILPPSTKVKRDTFGEIQPSSLLGYHFNSVAGGQYFSYSVDIPSGNSLGLSLNDFLTFVTSHELGEAVTDEAAIAPDPHIAGVYDFAGPTGWYYTPLSGGGEIGDLCVSAPPINLQGYMVQQLWTNFLAQSNFSHCGLVPASGSPQLPGQPSSQVSVARILYDNFKPTPANTAPKPTPAPPAPQGPIGSPQPNTQLPLPVEPTLSVSPTNDLNLALASQNGLKVSTNGGNTWTSPFTFPIASTGDSSTVFDKNGTLYWANINSSGGISVSVRNPTTGAAAAGPYTVDTPPAGFTDTQVFLTADNINDGPQNNNLFATWTQLGPNNSSAILLSSSSDGGQTWSTPVQVSSASDGYVWGSTVSVAPNGEVFVAYHSQPGFTPTSDGGIVPDGSGRTFVAGYSNDLSTQPLNNTLAFTSGQSDVTSNVQTGNRTIPGTTFLTQGSWTPYVLAGPSRPGTVYVVAANDPNANVSSNVDHSDIVLATSSDYGNTWTTSTVESASNQPGAANPNSFQLFPTATIDQNGDLLISWYSNQRGLTNAQGDYELDTYAAYSTDGGQNWSAPIQLDTTAFDPNAGAVNALNGPPATTTIGNFFGVALSGSQAYAAYNSNTFQGVQPASEQVAFTSFAIAGNLDIYGAPSSSTIHIVKQSPTSGIDEVFLNNSLIYSGALSSLNQINIVRNTDVDTFGATASNVNLGNVTVFLDYSNGDPVPGGGIDFGGSDLESNLIEVNANANYTLSNTSLTIATASQTDKVTLDNVQQAELIGGSSTNTFTLSNWTGSTTINGSGGTVVVGAGTVQTSQLIVSNVPLVQVAAGGTLDVNANFTVPNVQVLTQGTLDIEDGITLTAAVTNLGALNPFGVATLAGNYTQGSTGSLNVAIGGTTPGAGGYSQLVVTGLATLDGTLNVKLINGFTPAAGEAFEIMTFNNLVGQFATDKFPTFGNNETFTANYASNNVTLTAN